MYIYHIILYYIILYYLILSYLILSYITLYYIIHVYIYTYPCMMALLNAVARPSGFCRIWCCFELFSVKRLLPARRGKMLEIFIVDESGAPRKPII